MIKVAIFGGSFDPPHKGHQYIVQRALELLNIDRLIVVPAYLNPFKSSSFVSPEQRLDWCHKIFDPIEGVKIDASEIRAGKAVYTSDTLLHLSKSYEVAYLIIGADNLSSITQWHKFEWIDARVTWVVATRVGYDSDRSMLRSSIVLEMDLPISSTDIREHRDFEMVDTKIKDKGQIYDRKRDDIRTDETKRDDTRTDDNR